MIQEAIGLGLVLSLIFSEVFGLAAGGMVVPGYLALNIHQPQKVIATLLVSLGTYGFIRFLSNFIFIYGRRRTVITVLVAFILGWISRTFFIWQVGEVHVELSSIGYILPGLIALWMERQGVIATISTMIIVSVLVRLILIVLTLGRI